MEKASATGAEANAATEVVNAGRSIVHSADDPCGRRMVRHPCGLWTGEGLEAWARGLLREILSPGRAKLVELQGAPCVGRRHQDGGVGSAS